MIAKLKRDIDTLKAEVTRLRSQFSAGSRVSQTTGGVMTKPIVKPNSQPQKANIPRWG